MIYRPQFPYLTPEGFQDEEFHYYFDSNDQPALSVGSLAVGQSLSGIPLVLQTDAPFLWRGLIIDNPSAAFAVRFRAPDGTYLSDDFVPIGFYSPIPPADHPPVGNSPTVLDFEIPCEKGSVVYLDIKRTG